MNKLQWAPSYKGLGITLSSNGGLSVYTPWGMMRYQTNVIKPVKIIHASYYEDTSDVCYGIQWFEGGVHFSYGPQDFSADARKFKIWWPGFLHKRFYAYRTLDTAQNIFDESIEGTVSQDFKIRDVAPKQYFQFVDYDGTVVVAECFGEEREWKHGIGYFKWLSWFVKPHKERDLSIAFSQETGPQKGSWKGGTVRHSITLRPGERFQAAFVRYCYEHNMQYVKEVDKCAYEYNNSQYRQKNASVQQGGSPIPQADQTNGALGSA